MEQIILGRKYFISRWVLAGYTTMATTGKITDDDMEAIGAVESFKLMRINREHPRSWTLKNTVEEIFQAELASIAAAENLFYREEAPE